MRCLRVADPSASTVATTSSHKLSDATLYITGRLACVFAMRASDSCMLVR